MTYSVTGEIVEWRGPAPFLFLPLPMEVGREIRDMSGRLSYGWGCIPATVTIGETTVTTSLFPRDETYFVPIKVALQRGESIGLGDRVELELQLDLGSS